MPITNDHQLSSATIQQLQGLLSSPPITSNCISRFICTQNTTTGGVDVVFHVADNTGIASVTLLRASVLDSSVATVLQTWSPAELLDYIFPDAANIAGVVTAYYWLRLEPHGTTGTSVLVGPQSLDLNPDLSAPAAPISISLSHDAAVNGTVRVYANVSGLDPSDTLRISVAGYRGNPSYVAVASTNASPAQFVLQATGETITAVAQAVSVNGVVSAYSPTATITISSTRTAPATPSKPDVVQFSGGNQLTWIAGAEPWITGYAVYRGQRGGTFGAATLIATVSPTGESKITYTDTSGLSGDYSYFIVAQSASGNSGPSEEEFPARTYSGTVLPPNSPGNQTNDATVDSVSSSGSALIRIYGPGGVGTGYTRTVGSASLPRPNGTISGNAFTTAYAVVYDTVNQVYLSFLRSDYPSTLPDEYEFVGYYTTVSNGTASGSGATAVAVIDGSGHVIQVNVTNSGSGYKNAEVDFSGGGGTDAQATANISGPFSGNGISSITVTNGGSGYTSAPTVTIVATDPGQQPGGGGGTDTPYSGGARYDSNPQNVNG